MNNLLSKLHLKKKQKVSKKNPKKSFQINTRIDYSSYIDDIMFAETIDADNLDFESQPPVLDNNPYYEEKWPNIATKSSSALSPSFRNIYSKIVETNHPANDNYISKRNDETTTERNEDRQRNKSNIERNVENNNKGAEMNPVTVVLEYSTRLSIEKKREDVGKESEKINQKEVDKENEDRHNPNSSDQLEDKSPEEDSNVMTEVSEANEEELDNIIRNIHMDSILDNIEDKKQSSSNENVIEARSEFPKEKNNSPERQIAIERDDVNAHNIEKADLDISDITVPTHSDELSKVDTYTQPTEEENSFSGSFNENQDKENISMLKDSEHILEQKLNKENKIHYIQDSGTPQKNTTRVVKKSNNSKTESGKLVKTKRDKPAIKNKASTVKTVVGNQRVKSVRITKQKNNFIIDKQVEKEVIAQGNENEEEKALRTREDKLDIKEQMQVEKKVQSVIENEATKNDHKNDTHIQNQLQNWKKSKERYKRELKELDQVIMYEKEATNHIISHMDNVTKTEHEISKRNTNEATLVDEAELIKQPELKDEKNESKLSNDIWSKPPSIPVRQATDKRNYSERLQSKKEHLDKINNPSPPKVKDFNKDGKELHTKTVENEGHRKVIRITKGEGTTTEHIRARPKGAITFVENTTKSFDSRTKEHNIPKREEKGLKRFSSTSKLDKLTPNNFRTGKASIRSSTPSNLSTRELKRSASMSFTQAGPLWNRLYEEAKEKKERIESWKNIEREKREKDEFKEIKKAPNINENSKKLIARRSEQDANSHIWDRLSKSSFTGEYNPETGRADKFNENQSILSNSDGSISATYRRQNIRREIEREEYEKLKFKECTFAPQINPTSQEIAAARHLRGEEMVYDQLYKEAKNKNMERKELFDENKRNQEQMEAPNTASSMFMTKKQEKEFLQRMVYANKDKEQKLESIREQLMREQNFTFHPNVRNTSLDLSVQASKRYGDNLYERSKEFRERKRLLEEKYEKILKEKQSYIFTNKNSERVMKEMKQRRLHSFYNLLTMDDVYIDGLLHVSNLKNHAALLKLPTGPLADVVNELIKEMEYRGNFEMTLSFHQFEQFLYNNENLDVEEISQQVRVFQNELGLEAVQEKLQKELKFQPSIDQHSKELDKMRHSRSVLYPTGNSEMLNRRFEELHSYEQKRRQKLEMAKQQKIQEELEQCTFEPEFISKRYRTKDHIV